MLNCFASVLIEWHDANGRDFPWRNDNDPVHIFIAECLLHRTRARNVVPIYERLRDLIPALLENSAESRKYCHKLLYPLGLKWRADMLMNSLDIVNRKFNGTVPVSRIDLLSLPGVGDYIASAFRVFSAGYDDPLMDANTVRIISRVYELSTSDSSRRTKLFREKYSELRNGHNSRKFGYSMIDLGALICKPFTPYCSICPVNKFCLLGAKATKGNE